MHSTVPPELTIKIARSTAFNASLRHALIICFRRALGSGIGQLCTLFFQPTKELSYVQTLAVILRQRFNLFTLALYYTHFPDMSRDDFN